MLSSRVKIWSFRGKAHLVFHWCLYNKNEYLFLRSSNIWSFIYSVSIILTQNRSQLPGASISHKGNGGKRARKFIGVMKQCIFAGKPILKKNYLLERVDSRVQHIWRLRVMSSCLKHLIMISVALKPLGVCKSKLKSFKWCQFNLIHLFVYVNLD